MGVYDVNGKEIATSGLSGTELQRKFKGKQILWLGDSIHAYTTPDGVTIPDYFEYDSLSICHNWCQGGTTLAKTGAENYQPFSCVGMIDALSSRDFTTQEKWQNDRNFVDQVADMKAFNMKDAYAMIIEFGTNDAWKNVPLDNPENPMDTSYTGGALRYVIKTILTKYPSLKLAVCTVPMGEGFADSEHTIPYDTRKQSGLIREICNHEGVPVIDINKDMCLNKYTESYYGQGHRFHAGKLRQVQLIEDQMCYFY